MPKQYGMVIDLQKCVGCGCCTMTCKTENNTQARANGQLARWAADEGVSWAEPVAPEVSRGPSLADLAAD